MGVARLIAPVKPQHRQLRGGAGRWPGDGEGSASTGGRPRWKGLGRNSPSLSLSHSLTPSHTHARARARATFDLYSSRPPLRVWNRKRYNLMSADKIMFIGQPDSEADANAQNTPTRSHRHALTPHQTKGPGSQKGMIEPKLNHDQPPPNNSVIHATRHFPIGPALLVALYIHSSLPADVLTDCLQGRDRRPELADHRQYLRVLGMLRGDAGHRRGVSSRPRRRRQRRAIRWILGEVVRVDLDLVGRRQGGHWGLLWGPVRRSLHRFPGPFFFSLLIIAALLDAFHPSRIF